jgi:hypothetical protein
VKFALSLPLLLYVTSLSGCKTLSIKPSPDRSLLELACPQPTPLLGRTRNDLTRKIEEMGTQYRKCRTARLAAPVEPTK